jgi:hypothetical protein
MNTNTIQMINRSCEVVNLPLIDPENYSDGRGLMKLNAKFKGILENSKSYNEALFTIYEYLVDEIYLKEPAYIDLDIDWFSFVPYLEIAGNQYSLIDQVFLNTAPDLKQKGSKK